MWSHFTFGIPPVVTSARCFRKRSSGLNKPKTLYGEKNPDGEGQEAKSSFTTPTRPPLSPVPRHATTPFCVVRVVHRPLPLGLVRCGSAVTT
jgi:hypothetical protein